MTSAAVTEVRGPVAVGRHPGRRRAVRLLAISATCVLGGIVPAGAALASTSSIQPQYTACYNSPSAANCDGGDALTSGCYQDSSDVASVYDPGKTGVLLEMRYSPHCRTIWSTVSNAGAQHADITRVNGPNLECDVVSGNTCRTQMLYDAGTKGYATGYSTKDSWNTTTY